VQILHSFIGSVQQYVEEIADPDRYRPDHCPQCEAPRPLTARGFYSRTMVDTKFDGSIPVRRYLCRCCKRTVSLLPEFALPYLRFSIAVIALFLIARLLIGKTLDAAAVSAVSTGMPCSADSSGFDASGDRPRNYAQASRRRLPHRRPRNSSTPSPSGRARRKPNPARAAQHRTSR
jgi:hypothetical protein